MTSEKLWSPSTTKNNINKFIKYINKEDEIYTYEDLHKWSVAKKEDFWNKYCNDKDKIISIDKFGESAPIDDLMTHFGFTVSNVIKKIEKII